MNMFVLWFVALLSVMYASSAEPEKNKYPTLKTFEVLKRVNMDDCEEKCDMNDDCVTFAWKPRGKKCYLMQIGCRARRGYYCGLKPCQDPKIPTTTTEPMTNPESGCQCGKTLGSRIVGGENAETNNYPWMIALSNAPASDPFQDQFCGATLIASRFAITAAHCVVRQVASNIVAVLGEHDLSSSSESVIPRKVVNVGQIIAHQDYNTVTYANDIALIKLAEDIDLTVYTPACLPSQGADFASQNAWVYGWGSLQSGGNYPVILQELQVQIKSQADCISTMGSDFTAIASGGQLCAGGIEGEDSCQGDSGGPLSVEIDGQHQLAGAVSSGIGCALAGYYGIYAEVSFYRSWVDQKMAENGGAVLCSA